MKLGYLKCVITGGIAAAAFLVAAVIAVDTIWFDSTLLDRAHHFHGGARRLEVARAYRHETYQNIPVILFLCVIALAFGIIAIRFYNHAKSDYR
ncbi:MAG TPA: hypothetical protein VGG19_04345 [Tepidisphaeraceae bacterium]|jgi:hypothetical protein